MIFIIVYISWNNKSLLILLMYGANMKIGLNVLWHSTGFPSGLSGFVSSVCLLVRVNVVDKNQERSVRFNESKVRLSLIHFGRLSVGR